MTEPQIDELTLSFVEEGKRVISESVEGYPSLTFSLLENILQQENLVIHVDEPLEVHHPKSKNIIYLTSNLIFYIVINELIEEGKLLVVPTNRTVLVCNLFVNLTEFGLDSWSSF